MTTDSGVYRIDLGNERFYVGSAKNLRQRKAQHRRAMESGKHSNRVVQSAFDLRGVFDFSVLELCAVEDLLAYEQVLLDEHFNDPKCANLLPVAGSALGNTHSPETRAKISAAHKGKKQSPEHRANNAAARTGRTCSPETRAKISAARKGSKHSLETLAKMSAALTGKKHSPESKAKIAAARLGTKATPATKAKMSAALTGIKRSPETRAKMSVSQRARWA